MHGCSFQQEFEGFCCHTRRVLCLPNQRVDVVYVINEPITEVFRICLLIGTRYLVSNQSLGEPDLVGNHYTNFPDFLVNRDVMSCF